MNLVLFEDAIFHILRSIALLVGVDGSGKQTLARLASFISSLRVFQITLRKGYRIPDLKVDLNALHMKTGVQKNIGMTFPMTDSQVADEKFLVLVNDLLVSGDVPGLFADDETENIINAVCNECKAVRISNTRDNCWKFFIDVVRCQLKVVLCFEWFDKWSKEAFGVYHDFFYQKSIFSQYACTPHGDVIDGCLVTYIL